MQLPGGLGACRDKAARGDIRHDVVVVSDASGVVASARLVGRPLGLLLGLRWQRVLPLLLLALLLCRQRMLRWMLRWRRVLPTLLLLLWRRLPDPACRARHTGISAAAASTTAAASAWTKQFLLQRGLHSRLASGGVLASHRPGRRAQDKAAAAASATATACCTEAAAAAAAASHPGGRLVHPKDRGELALQGIDSQPLGLVFPAAHRRRLSTGRGSGGGSGRVAGRAHCLEASRLSIQQKGALAWLLLMLLLRQLLLGHRQRRAATTAKRPPHGG